MDALGLPLLIIAAVLAFQLVVARREGRRLTVGASQLREAINIAGRAALTFWLTFVLIAAVGIALAVVFGDVGEWGPLFTFVAVFVACAVLGAVAALSHGVTVVLLPDIYSGMDLPHRRASSAVTALGVILVVFLVQLCKLGQAPAAYEGFLQTLRAPGWIAFHVIALAFALPHASCGASRIGSGTSVAAP